VCFTSIYRFYLHQVTEKWTVNVSRHVVPKRLSISRIVLRPSLCVSDPHSVCPI